MARKRRAAPKSPVDVERQPASHAAQNPVAQPVDRRKGRPLALADRAGPVGGARPKPGGAALGYATGSRASAQPRVAKSGHQRRQLAMPGLPSGRGQCRQTVAPCQGHGRTERAYRAWQLRQHAVQAPGLDHALLQRGDRYFVHTDGPDGKLADFEIKYTFGVEPLQQYLIETDGGRLQPLRSPGTRTRRSGSTCCRTRRRRRATCCTGAGAIRPATRCASPATRQVSRNATTRRPTPSPLAGRK